jgi:hypothetical protein
VLPFSLSIFSSVGIEVLFTAVLNRRLLYKSDIQPHHLKRSYSVGKLGPGKQYSHKQSVTSSISDGDIVGAMLEMCRCSQTEKSVKVQTGCRRHTLFRCIHDENLMEIPQ